MEEKFIAIVQAYESGAITYEVAWARIRELTGQEIDRYTLDQYSCSQDVEELARRWCMPPIADWQAIDDTEALRLIREMLDDVCNLAVLERNWTALEKRYGKPSGTISGLIFHSEKPTAEGILAALRRDTRFYM